MRPKGVYLSVAVVCFVLGLIITLQYRATSSIQNNLPVKRAQDLTVELQSLKGERDALASEVGDLQKKLNQARAGGSSAEKALQSEIERARLAAGLVAVTGSGIELVLENQATGTPAAGDNLYQIHDEDLLKVINELRAAGSEALAINNQRVVATTEIRLAGNTILVNVKKIVQPYHILAIGNPQTLESSLRIKGGILDTLNFWGIKATILSKDKINIPAFEGRQNFKYAKAIKEGQ